MIEPLSSLSQAWLIWWVDTTIKSLVVLTSVSLVAFALPGASAAQRHLLWFAGLLAALVISVVPGSFCRWEMPLFPSHLFSSESVHPESDAPLEESVSPGALATPTLGETPKPESTTPLALWLFGAWALGAAFVAVSLLLGHGVLLRLRLRGRRVTDRAWQTDLDSCRRALALRRRVLLLENPREQVPLVGGLLWSYVAIPQVARDWSPYRRRIVLLHELAHVKRWDTLALFAGRLVALVQWANPLVWIALRQLRIESERASDDLVLGDGVSPHEYATSLLEFSQEFPSLPQTRGALPIATRSLLERRLLMILDTNQCRTALQRATLVLACGFALVFALGLVSLDLFAEDKLPVAKPPVKFQQPLEIEFEGQTFLDAVEFIRFLTDADIIVHRGPLKRAGVRLDTKNTMHWHLQDMTIHDVLIWLVRRLGNDAELSYDEGIAVISAKPDKDANKEARADKKERERAKTDKKRTESAIERAREREKKRQERENRSERKSWNPQHDNTPESLDTLYRITAISTDTQFSGQSIDEVLKHIEMIGTVRISAKWDDLRVDQGSEVFMKLSVTPLAKQLKLALDGVHQDLTFRIVKGVIEVTKKERQNRAGSEPL